MAEYIDRNTFLAKKREWYCQNCDRRKNSKGKLVYEIGDAPCRACDIGDILDAIEDYHAADVVDVVRCKDCIQHVPDSCFCRMADWTTRDEDFCSLAVKRRKADV